MNEPTRVKSGVLPYAHVTFASGQNCPAVNATVTRATITLPPGLYLIGGYQYTNRGASSELVFKLVINGTEVIGTIENTYPVNPRTLRFVRHFKLETTSTVEWQIMRRAGTDSFELNHTPTNSFGWYVRLSD